MTLVALGAEREGDPQRGDVVGDGRDRHDVVAVVFERVRVGAGLGQRTHRVVLACERRDMQRRAAVGVARVDVAAAGRELRNRRAVSAVGGREQAAIRRGVRRCGRLLGESGGAGEQKRRERSPAQHGS